MISFHGDEDIIYVELIKNPEDLFEELVLARIDGAMAHYLFHSCTHIVNQC